VPARPDPDRILAALARDGRSLKLDTTELCFLVGLHLRAEVEGLATFEEELVIDVFEQACELVEPNAENPRKRATHAIQRLRDQRMLARVDASGVVGAGDYALTSLATVIVRTFVEDDRLTRESLSLLTGAVIASLSRIKIEAQRAKSEEDWRTVVVGPLRVTVGDLVAGIERRQRGLDSQQEEVQQRIGEMLQADWFGAVEQCQDLLETTTATLKELNDVLLRDGNQIQVLLQELLHAASEHHATEAEDAAQRVSEHVDRMMAWGSARQSAWSGYYQSVHRYLRDVVRLDPDRALSQRLMEQLRGWPERPFFLRGADEGRILLLRPITAREQRAPVARPRRDRERDLDVVVPEDRQAALEALVRAALSEGLRELGAVTRRVLEQLDEDRRYAAAGQIAALVAELSRPRAARERPWVVVSHGLEIEDWSLQAPGEVAER
jgi:chromosome partition protein MukF